MSTASGTVEANRFTRDGKLLVGKGRWLFLDNDTNNVVRQHTGDLLFSPAGLRRWQLVLGNRTAWAERMGVVCGDSYSYTVLPLLAESFRRLVFAQTSTLDHAQIRKERPDVVISILCERFLLEPPRDDRSPSAMELASVKLAQGKCAMPNMGPLWGQETPLRDVSALP